MARKRHTAEEIVGHLRTSEIDLGNGSAVPEACRKFRLTEQTYYRWEKGYGGPRVDQAKRLKGLEQEHARLKRLVTNLSLDHSILKEVATGHCQVRPDAEKRCAMLSSNALGLRTSGLSSSGTTSAHPEAFKGKESMTFGGGYSMAAGRKLTGYRRQCQESTQPSNDPMS